MNKVVLILAVLIAWTNSFAYDRLYVKPGSGSSMWDGRSPVYETINAAIIAADQYDSIWVGEGKYGKVTETLTFRRNLYGGFVGTENKLADRGNYWDYWTRTIIDGNGSGPGLACAGKNTVDGFYFYRCRNAWGGGICADQAAEYHIRYCIFDSCGKYYASTPNDGAWGAAVLFTVGSTNDTSSVDHCIAFQCHAWCGIFEMIGSNDNDTDNTIFKVTNTVIDSCWGYAIEFSHTDGGDDPYPATSPIIKNNIIVHNMGRTTPSGGWAEDCGLQSFAKGSPEISNNTKYNMFQKGWEAGDYYRAPDGSNIFLETAIGNSSCLDNIGTAAFYDSTNHNYRLRGDSMAKKLGAGSGLPTYMGAFAPYLKRKVILTQ